jgi:hypothetical protein
MSPYGPDGIIRRMWIGNRRYCAARIGPGSGRVIADQHRTVLLQAVPGADSSSPMISPGGIIRHRNRRCVFYIQHMNGVQYNPVPGIIEPRSVQYRLSSGRTSADLLPACAIDARIGRGKMPVGWCEKRVWRNDGALLISRHDMIRQTGRRCGPRHPRFLDRIGKLTPEPHGPGGYSCAAFPRGVPAG